MVSWILVVRTLLEVTGRAQVLFLQMELRELPVPTELILIVSDFLRTIWTFIGMVLAVGTLALLTVRGHFDHHLRTLIVVNLIALSIVIPFWIFSIGVPIVRIAGPLSK